MGQCCLHEIQTYTSTLILFTFRSSAALCFDFISLVRNLGIVLVNINHQNYF